MSSAGSCSPSLAISRISNTKNGARYIHVCGRSGFKIRPISSHVFVPSAEVSTASPIKVLLCRPHFDLSVLVNHDIAPRNKENKAHAFARFAFPGRSKRLYVKNYVARRPGSGSGDYRSVAIYKTSFLLLSLLFSTCAFKLATPK